MIQLLQNAFILKYHVKVKLKHLYSKMYNNNNNSLHSF